MSQHPMDMSLEVHFQHQLGCCRIVYDLIRMPAKRVRSKEQISYNMSRIRGKNTRPEILLRRALRKSGLRYRLHYAIVGKPDVVFPRFRLAVFCDGEFWHGKDFRKLQEELTVNRSFWMTKIRSNIARDKKVNRMLNKMGWSVVRLWNREIVKNTEKCVQLILSRMK